MNEKSYLSDNIFIIPEEINSEVMLVKGLYFLDLAVMAGCYMFFDLFRDLVHPLLQIPYLIFSILIGFLITRKSKDNPGKRVIFSIMYRLIKPFNPQIYHRREVSILSMDDSIEDYLERDGGRDEKI